LHSGDIGVNRDRIYITATDTKVPNG